MDRTNKYNLLLYSLRNTCIDAYQKYNRIDISQVNFLSRVVEETS